jgi:hypothetical protein
MNTTTTYEGYWNAVVGAGMSAEEVMCEFCLSPKFPNEIIAYLSRCEDAAAKKAGIAKAPKCWKSFRAQALAELTSCTY